MLLKIHTVCKMLFSTRTCFQQGESVSSIYALLKHYEF